MGLEIAEIMMDLEDEFLLVIDTNVNLDGTVRSLEDHVVSTFSRQRYLDVIHDVDALPYADDHVLSRSEYKWTRQSVDCLPRGFIWVPKQYDTKAKIRGSLQSRFDRYRDEEAIRVGVRRVIENRLQTRKPVKSSDHLVRDLGAD